MPAKATAVVMMAMVRIMVFMARLVGVGCLVRSKRVQ
jgi:hypothetical protein